MRTLKKILLRLVRDVVEEIRDAYADDPLGDMTVLEAADLMSDYKTLTVRQAERMFALARDMGTLPTAATPKSSAEKQAEAAGYKRVTDKETLERLAAQAGIPVDQVIAYQPQAAQSDMVMTAKGPVSRKDIPRGPDGNPTKEWLDEYCDCEEHKARRKTGASATRSKAGSGGYL